MPGYIAHECTPPADATEIWTWHSPLSSACLFESAHSERNTMMGHRPVLQTTFENMSIRRRNRAISMGTMAIVLVNCLVNRPKSGGALCFTTNPRKRIG